MNNVNFGRDKIVLSRIVDKRFRDAGFEGGMTRENERLRDFFFFIESF